MKARNPTSFYGIKSSSYKNDSPQKYDKSCNLLCFEKDTSDLNSSNGTVNNTDSQFEGSPVSKKCKLNFTHSQTIFSSSQEILNISSPITMSHSSPVGSCNTSSSSTKSPIAMQSSTSTCCSQSLHTEKIFSSVACKVTASPSISAQKTEQYKTKQRTISSYFNESFKLAKDNCSSSPAIWRTVPLSNNGFKHSTKVYHQVLLKPCEKENIQVSFSPFDLQESPRQQRKLSSKLNPKKCAVFNSRMEQTYIDFGQKDFGHVTCTICGMVYTKSQADDESQHAKYHENVVQKLKFPGWKNERLMQEFHDGRIIMIKSSDNHIHQKKLLDIRDIIDTELGITIGQDIYSKSEQQAYLFVSAKKIVGCAIALPITKAYPIIVNSEITSPEKACGAPTNSWCCSTEAVPAVCGISRIWVFSQNRRQNIASRIVDCIRHNFLYGCVISKNELAFSDPTPDGRIFAEKYMGDPRILVFW